MYGCNISAYCFCTIHPDTLMASLKFTDLIKNPLSMHLVPHANILIWDTRTVARLKNISCFDSS